MVMRFPIPDLEWECSRDGIGSADFFFKLYFPVNIRRKVEAHVQVGGAGAALHVIHLHGMAGVIFKDRSGIGPVILKDSVQPLVYFCLRLIRILCFICRCETFSQIGFLAIFNYFSCAEIDTSVERRVNTSQIQNQDVIDIEPEVIIPGEFEDQVMPPIVQSALALHEVGVHFHPEEVVNISRVGIVLAVKL